MHHTLFSRQTVLLWHTKEPPRLAEPQPRTKGARCWDPKWSGVSNAIIVYQGAARCRVSHVRHISVCWQPQWKERERSLQKNRCLAEEGNPCPFAWCLELFLEFPAHLRLTTWSIVAKSQTARTRSGPCKDSLGKLATCCLQALSTWAWHLCSCPLFSPGLGRRVSSIVAANAECSLRTSLLREELRIFYDN